MGKVQKANAKVQFFSRDADGSFGNVAEVLRDELQIEYFEYSEDESISEKDSNALNQIIALLPDEVNFDINTAGLLMVMMPEMETETSDLASRCECRCGGTMSCGGGGGGH